MAIFNVLRVSASIALLALLLPRIVSAQFETPIDPTYEHPRIGGEIGLSSVWQTGRYHTVPCGDFEKGARLNPIMGLAYDYPISQNLRFEAFLGYGLRSLSSVYNSRETVQLKTSEGKFVRVDIDFENEGAASFSYIFLMPSLKFYPIKGIYVGGGINGGMLLSATTQYTKNILTKTIDVPGLGISEVYYPEEESSDPYSKVYPEEERTDAAGFAVDAALYAGAEFKVTNKIKIGPRLLYTLPLTSVLSDDDELKLNSFQFLVGLRYDLN